MEISFLTSTKIPSQFSMDTVLFCSHGKQFVFLFKIQILSFSENIVISATEIESNSPVILFGWRLQQDCENENTLIKFCSGNSSFFIFF